MSENPTFPGVEKENQAVVVRVNPPYSIEERDEDGGEVRILSHEDDEVNVDVRDRLAENQQYINRSLNSWELKDVDFKLPTGEEVKLVVNPMASKLHHRALHPGTYRYLKEIKSLDHLARLVSAPDDWESRYNNASDDVLQALFEQFTSLDHTQREVQVQHAFTAITGHLGSRLGIAVFPVPERRIIIGGLCASTNFDIRHHAGPSCFGLGDRKWKLASEIKSSRVFKEGDTWYHGFKGFQVLSTLYSLNCPTFLLTPEIWKIFVENPERDAVYTFPFLDDETAPHLVRSAEMHLMGATFLKAIAICLLAPGKKSAADLPAAERPNVGPTPSAKRSENMDEFSKPRPRPLFPLRRSERIAMRPGPAPKYVARFDENDLPVYNYVRVMNEEDVIRIENEIDEAEKAKKARER